MHEFNCSQNGNTCTYPKQWSLDELEARAGALVGEALEKWPDSVRAAHWEDMKHVAMLAFLEYSDKASAYGYAVASSALKNYKWVHIRGLNGGWKSLVARNYTVSEAPLEIDGDKFDSPYDNLYWRLFRERPWEVVPRPVEWKVVAKLDDTGIMPVEAVFRDILYILAGMSRTNWYPDQIYQAALIITMLTNSYTWEDVEQHTRLDYYQVWNIWWHYRKTRLAPYLKLEPMHQEIVKCLGQARLAYFEDLSCTWLNYPSRKMVVLSTGIFTITYKRRGRKRGQAIGDLEASLQKGHIVNGRPVVRAVSLGKVGHITKKRLLESSHQLKRKLEGS